MKVAERHKKILVLVKGQPCTIEDMAHALAVSPVTVRRDLSRLAEQGLLTRTLGGAAASVGVAERSLEQRANFAKEEKRRIAEAASTHITAEQTLFLDSGTSAGALADIIADQAEALPGLTIVTASLSVASKLCEVAPIRLILLGGELRRLSQGMLGPIAERALENLTFDIAFLSGDALSPVHGIGETEPSQTRLKELIIRKSIRTIALGHADKLNRADTHHWAALPVGTIVITDVTGASMTDIFQKNGHTLVSV